MALASNELVINTNLGIKFGCSQYGQLGTFEGLVTEPLKKTTATTLFINGSKDPLTMKNNVERIWKKEVSAKNLPPTIFDFDGGKGDVTIIKRIIERYFRGAHSSPVTPYRSKGKEATTSATGALFIQSHQQTTLL